MKLAPASGCGPFAAGGALPAAVELDWGRRRRFWSPNGRRPRENHQSPSRRAPGSDWHCNSLLAIFAPGRRGRDPVCWVTRPLIIRTALGFQVLSHRFGMHTQLAANSAIGRTGCLHLQDTAIAFFLFQPSRLLACSSFVGPFAWRALRTTL